MISLLLVLVLMWPVGTIIDEPDPAGYEVIECEGF